MPKKVDTRIVQLKLDNSDFSKKAKETKQTIKDLEKDLEFKDVAKGFSNITKASDKVDLSKITKQVNNATKDFDSLTKDASKSLSGITRASDKVDLSGITDGASSVTSNIGKMVGDVTEGITSITSAADDVDFSSIAQATVSLAGSFDETLETAEGAFTGITKASGDVKMTALTNKVDDLTRKFSLLGIAAMTSVSKAVDKLTDGMASFIKSAALDPINKGWDAYAEKTSAVQTIMAATNGEYAKLVEQGMDMKQIDWVTNIVEQLAWFADETSYSFQDMLSNVGKFTSQGISLEEATKQMEGIATWAALAGVNTQGAARAMYNISQAMGVGAFHTVDWMSIENAGMATKQFKELALEMAVAEGNLEKLEDGMYRIKDTANLVDVASFREHLSDNWFDSAVIQRTLSQYGDFTQELSDMNILLDESFSATEILKMLEKYQAGTLDLNKLSKQTGVTVDDLHTAFARLASDDLKLSRAAFLAAQEAKTFQEAIESIDDASRTKWGKTFELIFGNYEEAKEVWTGLAEGLYTIFVDPLNYLKDTFQAWNNLGGRVTFIEGLKAGFDSLLEIVGAVQDGIYEALGIAGDSFDSAGGKVKAFTDKIAEWFKANKPTAETLGLIRDSVESIATTIGTVFKMIGKVFGIVIPKATETNALIFKLIGLFRKTTTGVGDFGEVFQKVFGKLIDVVGAVMDSVNFFLKEIIYGFNLLNSYSWNKQRGALMILFAPFKTLANLALNLFSIFTGRDVTDAKSAVSKFFDKVIEKISLVVNWFKSKGKAVIEWFKSIPEAVSNAWESMNNWMSAKWGWNLAGVFESIGNAASNAWEKIKGFFSKIPSYIVSAATAVGGFGLAVGKGFGGALLDSIGEISGWIGAIKHFKSPITAVRGAFNILISPIKFVTNGILNFIETITGKQMVGAREFLEKFFNVLDQGFIKLGGVVSKVIDWFKALPDKIKEAYKTADAWFGDTFGITITQIWEGFANTITSAWESVKNFFKNLAKSDDALEESSEKASIFARIWGGVVTVFTAIINVIKGIPDACKKAYAWIDGLVIKLTGTSIKEHWDKIKESVEKAWGAVKEFFSRFKSDSDVDESTEKMGFWATIWEGIKTAFEKIKGAVEWALPKIQAALEKFWEKAGPFINNIKEHLIGIDWANLLKSGGIFAAGAAALKLVNGGGLFGLGKKDEGGETYIEGFLNEFKKVGTKAAELLGGFKDTLKAFQTDIKANVLLKIAAAVVVLVGSMLLLAGLDDQSFDQGLLALSSLMAELAAFFIVISKMSGNAAKMAGISAALLVMSLGIVALTIPMKVLSKLSWDELSVAVVAVSSLVGLLILFTQWASTDNAAMMVVAAAALFILAKALAKLAPPFILLSALEANALKTGLLGVGGMLLALAEFLRIVDDVSVEAATVAALSSIGWTILKLIPEIAILGKMDTNQLKIGCLALGGILLALGMFLLLANKSGLGKGKSGGAEAAGIGKLFGAAAIILSIAAAVLVLVHAIKEIGELDQDTAKQGLMAVIAITAILGGIAILAALAGSLGGGVGSLLAASVMIIALAAALRIMVPALQEMNSVEWGSVWKALILLAGGLAIIAIAGYAVEPIIPVIVSLASAIALLVGSVALIGVSFLAFAAGMKIIAEMGEDAWKVLDKLFETLETNMPAFMTALGNSLVAFLKSFFMNLAGILKELVPLIDETVKPLIKSVINLISYTLQELSNNPELFAALKTVLDYIIDILDEEVPKIMLIIGDIFSGIIDMVYNNWPKIEALLWELGSFILEFLKEYSPQINQLIFTLLFDLLDKLEKNIDEIVDKVVDIVNLAVSTLTKRLDDITVTIFNFVLTALNALVTECENREDTLLSILKRLTAVATDFAFNFIIDTMEAIAKAIDDNIDDLIEAFLHMCDSIFKAILKFFGIDADGISSKFEDTGGNIIKGLIAGVKEWVSKAWGKVKEKFELFVSCVKRFFGIEGNPEDTKAKFYQVGHDVVKGFTTAILHAGTNIWELVKGVFEGFVDAVKEFFEINSPSKVFARVGSGTIEGFEQGVTDEGESGGGLWEKLKHPFTSFVDGAKALFTKDNAQTVGGAFVQGYQDGINNAANSGGGLWAKLKAPFEAIVSGVQNVCSPSTFTQIGKNITDGLVDGVKGRPRMAERVAGEFAELQFAAERILGIHSPSKVFESIGNNLDLGFIKGVDGQADNMSGSVVGAISDAITAAKTTMLQGQNETAAGAGLFGGLIGGGIASGLTDAMSRLTGSDSLLGDLENPTITPVLDLTEIENGKGRLTSMLGEDEYGVFGNFGLNAFTSDRLSDNLNLSGLTNQGAGASFASGEVVVNQPINMTINAAQGQDVNAIADAVSRKLSARMEQTQSAMGHRASGQHGWAASF